MKYYVMMASLCGALLSGCSTTATETITPAKPLYTVSSAQKQTAYNQAMLKVGMSTRSDSKYQRIDLTSGENKEWFKDLTFKLWDRQITRAQFVEEGLSKYPTHRYEFEFVAEGFNR